MYPLQGLWCRAKGSSSFESPAVGAPGESHRGGQASGWGPPGTGRRRETRGEASVPSAFLAFGLQTPFMPTATGTDVLCLRGVLGGHDVHGGREELVVSGT